MRDGRQSPFQEMAANSWGGIGIVVLYRLSCSWISSSSWYLALSSFSILNLIFFCSCLRPPNNQILLTLSLQKPLYQISKEGGEGDRCMYTYKYVFVPVSYFWSRMPLNLSLSISSSSSLFSSLPFFFSSPILLSSLQNLQKKFLFTTNIKPK